MKKGSNKIWITVLIITGILICYINQMTPSPILTILQDKFHLAGNDALLNLCVSIIFPLEVIGGIAGGYIEQKIGVKKLFSVTMIFLAVGLFSNYVAPNYAVFLIGRMLYGIGFGLGIPFIGSVIMKWYNPKQREVMNTVNGFLPFVGTLISFISMVPLYQILGNSWKGAMGIWGIPVILILIVWVYFLKEPETQPDVQKEEKAENNIYFNLLKRKEILLLSLIFMCDFFCYSYIAIIFPTLLFEISHMSETVANLWAAVAFPVTGFLGCVAGGTISAKTEKRKPTLACGQMLKFVGIIVATLGMNISIWFVIVGIAMFGFGTGMWMPVMYNIPMELKNMTVSRVGAAFSLMSSCGFFCGFISPTIGGKLTNFLMTMTSNGNSVARHVFGLRWSLFTFAFLNVIAFVCALAIRETGPGAAGKHD